MKMKLLASCALILCMLLNGSFSEKLSSVVSSVGQSGKRIEESTEYTDGDLSLTADPLTGEIRINNRRTGGVWYSNPPDKEEDTVAAGFNKMNLYSQLVITYLDKNRQSDSTNSYVGSVKKKDFYCEQIEKGFRFVFSFSSEGFVIPVEYTLEGDVFRCNVPLDRVEENGDCLLSEIRLLPLFGAGSGGEEGYILLPDGCGALIDFQWTPAQAKGLSGYSSYVYGRDPVLTKTTVSGRTETLLLPMFGVKKGEEAFLAVIESGDAVSTITAVPNYKESSYAAVSASLIYRNTDSAILREMKSSEKSVLVYDETPAALEQYTVAYHLLSGSEADYSGMARVAREYYESLGMQGSAPKTGLYLELTAGARMTDFFLGIPMKRYSSFTTLSQAREILRYLGDGGVKNIAVKYDAMFADGAYYKMTRDAKIESNIKDISLGDFLQETESLNDRVFPTVDLLRIFASGNGVSKDGDGVRNVSGGIYNGYSFLRSTTRKDTSAEYYTIAKAEKFAELVSDYLSNMGKRGIRNYADLTSGSILPSDHHRSLFGSRTPVDRQQALDVYKKAYGEVTETADARLFDSACGYVFPYATDLTSLPMQSSRYELFTAEVPFVQMAVHGRIAYSSQRVNLCDDTDLAMLKCLEYGSIPLFSLVYEGTDRLMESEYSDRYSSGFRYWRDKILTYNTRFGEALDRIAGRTMLRHTQIMTNVFLTQYSDGISVAVNYSDSPAQVEGKTVGAGSFAIWEG